MGDTHFVRAGLVLPVDDMKRAREWYADTLGMETVYLHTDPVEDPEGNFATLRRDDAELHLILDEPPRTHPWTMAGTGYMFLTVRGVDAAYEEALASGAAIRRGIEEEGWGARAFQLTDPSGNLILVAEHAG